MSPVWKNHLVIVAFSCLGFNTHAMSQEFPNPVGKAYEMTGITRYISVPSKILFTNKEFLHSKIIDAYRLSEIIDAECQIPKGIKLVKRKAPWWSGPIYAMASINSQQENKSNKDVVIIPRTNPLQKCDEVEPRKFIVDAQIVAKLADGSKNNVQK